MPVIQTEDSEAPLWTIISSLTYSAGYPIRTHLFTSTVSPLKFTVQFSWSRVSISKNFRYSELHFKISPGNPVAFRRKFNLISTCSIHCVKIGLGKENRIRRIRLARNFSHSFPFDKNTLSDFWNVKRKICEVQVLRRKSPKYSKNLWGRIRKILGMVWTIISLVTNSAGYLRNSYSFIYINCQPSQLYSAIFLEYRGSIS